MANTNNYPIYAQKPRTAGGVVLSAMTGPTTDAPTGLILIATAGANGSIMTRAWASGRGGTTASALSLYVKRTDSAHYQQVDSVALTTIAASTTAARPYAEFTRYTIKNPLELGIGDQIYAGVDVTQTSPVDVNVTLRDF